MDLATQSHFREFGLPAHRRDRLPDLWKTQQGVVFLSRETLAAYQVEENTGLPPMSPRDLSGGGGHYRLRVVFLSTEQDGKQVGELAYVTDGSNFSEVIRTHDGQFIIRTGEHLRLFSSSLRELSSLSLPMTGKVPNESWLLVSEKSGLTLIAQHDEDSGPGGYYKSDFYSIDADTLQLKHMDDSEEDFLRRMIVDPSGMWRKHLPKALLRKNEGFYSAVGNGRYIAGEIDSDRFDPMDIGIGPEPKRVVLYDLVRKMEVCAEPIKEPVSGWPQLRLYAVSSEGDLAIVQKSRLTIWRP